jgi:hypothetical protein
MCLQKRAVKNLINIRNKHFLKKNMTNKQQQKRICCMHHILKYIHYIPRKKNLSTFIVSSTKMLQKIMSVMNDRASFNYLAKKCKFVTIMTLQVNTTPES